MAMADLPDTMVNFPVTMVDLPNTMVYLPNTMVDLPNTMVDLTSYPHSKKSEKFSNCLFRWLKRRVLVYKITQLSAKHSF